MKKVLIVRGLPGCGKTTYVEKLTSGCSTGLRICSADHFFVRAGRYEFDPAKLPQAHNDCMRRFLWGLKNKTDLVIADNTFVRHWEWESYALAGEVAGYEVEVHEFRVRTVDQIWECHRRCRHGVPYEVMARMAMDFEPYDKAVVVKLEGM